MKIEDVYREVAPKLQSYLTGNGCPYATACDIVQETFLRLWKRKDELTDDLHQVSGLVFTIARNYRNDLARKAHHEVLSMRDEGCGTGDECDGSVYPGDVTVDAARTGEAEEECTALRRRLRASLGRMPVALLETFALSRLGKLTVKDIASGTGASEANVKVRVHRAKDLFKECFSGKLEEDGGKSAFGDEEASVLKAMMMLAAVDGEIAREELSLYRVIAQETYGENAATFDELWEQSVRAMAYIGFLSEMLSPEELVREYVRETGAIPGRFLSVLERMASADGDYSRIERDCISALAKVED